jgi:hypothetical protein
MSRNQVTLDWIGHEAYDGYVIRAMRRLRDYGNNRTPMAMLCGSLNWQIRDRREVSKWNPRPRELGRRVPVKPTRRSRKPFCVTDEVHNASQSDGIGKREKEGEAANLDRSTNESRRVLEEIV